MKTALTIGALTFLACPSPASDPSSSRRFETEEKDGVAAVRTAMRSMKPGMAQTEVTRLLPRGTLSVAGFAGGIGHSTYSYGVYRGTRLVVSFNGDDRLTGAFLYQDGKVVQQVGN